MPEVFPSHSLFYLTPKTAKDLCLQRLQDTYVCNGHRKLMLLIIYAGFILVLFWGWLPDFFRVFGQSFKVMDTIFKYMDRLLSFWTHFSSFYTHFLCWSPKLHSAIGCLKKVFRFRMQQVSCRLYYTSIYSIVKTIWNLLHSKAGQIFWNTL